jgi:nucleoside-diphosphate-sugar epimerase
MKVLVTGGSGFVGTAVSLRLGRLGHGVLQLTGDVRDPGCYPSQQVDAVIHLAALISHRRNYTTAQLFDVNVSGTERLLARFPAAHFVYVSTTDVERPKISEYARSKLEAERLVARHARHCIVRLPSVFGPGQRQQSKLIPTLLRKYVLCERGAELTDDACRCLFIDDAAEAVCAGLDQNGTISVAGILVRNHDLDRLVAAAARGDPPETVAVNLRTLFIHLRECVEYMRGAVETGPQSLPDTSGHPQR